MHQDQYLLPKPRNKGPQEPKKLLVLMTVYGCSGVAIRKGLETSGVGDAWEIETDFARRDAANTGCGAVRRRDRELLPTPRQRPRVEKIDMSHERPCSALTKDGFCSQQDHKPRLCRTYYCYGRLWRPKRECNG